MAELADAPFVTGASLVDGRRDSGGGGLVELATEGELAAGTSLDMMEIGGDLGPPPDVRRPSGGVLVPEIVLALSLMTEFVRVILGLAGCSLGVPGLAGPGARTDGGWTCTGVPDSRRTLPDTGWPSAAAGNGNDVLRGPRRPTTPDMTPSRPTMGEKSAPEGILCGGLFDLGMVLPFSSLCSGFGGADETPCTSLPE